MQSVEGQILSRRLHHQNFAFIFSCFDYSITFVDSAPLEYKQTMSRNEKTGEETKKNILSRNSTKFNKFETPGCETKNDGTFERTQ